MQVRETHSRPLALLCCLVEFPNPTKYLQGYVSERRLQYTRPCYQFSSTIYTQIGPTALQIQKFKKTMSRRMIISSVGQRRWCTEMCGKMIIFFRRMCWEIVWESYSCLVYNRSFLFPGVHLSLVICCILDFHDHLFILYF